MIAHRFPLHFLSHEQVRKSFSSHSLAEEDDLVPVDFGLAHGRGDGGEKIELLIDRKDETINLCEMKYSKDKSEISLAEEQKLSARLDAFRTETHTKKSVLLTLITTNGIKQNSHSDIVQSEVTLEDLFW